MDRASNLLLRIASAAVLLPAVLYLVWRGGPALAALLAVGAAACTGEYYVMTLGRLTPGTSAGLVLAALLPVWPVLWPARAAEGAVATLAATLVFAWLEPLVRRPEHPSQRAAHLVTGVAYPAVGLWALAALRGGPDGLAWFIAALVVTWANDTMAYFVGRLVGRHKLYPEVSPNKTWEGFAGGLVGSVGGLFVLRAVYFPALTPADCVVLGLLGGILGPIGDLSESMLKRAHGVKDSSRLIPGHGGFLDRIDALLFNAPLVYVYARLLRVLFV